MGLKIGVTGGIGSGKSMVCRIFKVLQIPVFDADSVAKTIMIDDARLRGALVNAFGMETYLPDGSLNRAYLSETVFSDGDKLRELNSLVHPVVIQAGDDWAANQTSPYSIKEAALLVESGSYKKLDYTILVTASEDIRLQRVMNRDGVTESQVRQRMAKQLSDEDKRAAVDFVIVNDGSVSLIQQVISLHQLFLTYV